jgi:hypothetical protein
VSELACLEREIREEFARLQLEQRHDMASTLFSDYFWVVMGRP